MQKTIIIGNGFIANHLKNKYIVSPDRFDADENQIKSFIEREKPDAIINTIGACGKPTIDWCNSHREETIRLNVTIPTMFAQACNVKGIQFVHIGSGCIFTNDSPNPAGWRETDYANPVSFYSCTKYSLDLAIQDLENVCILRIRMPISAQHSKRNLVTKLLSYRNVIDTPNSVTFLGDLERAIVWAVDKSKMGVYHVTNPGPISAVDIVNRYHILNRSQTTINVISAEQLNSVVKARRSNCILDSSKIISEGLDLPNSSDLLNHYLTEYIYNSKDI